MTCNDCIHINVCVAYEPEEPECICNHFKNKADYTEVKHGHWIKRGNEKKCSVCGFVYYSNNDDWNGCPNCLAKIDGRS